MTTYTASNARKGSTGTVHRVIIDSTGTAYARCDGRKQLRGFQVTTDPVTCRSCKR